jgi:hypothetical protein
MKAAIMRRTPEVPVIDLLHDVPAFDIRAAAYLLPAYTADFPPESVFVCVVDPGVGGDRPPVIVQADGRWFIGPGNGLFTLLLRRDADAVCRVIDWRPAGLSDSFHGRDLFAPVAARLARGHLPDSRVVDPAPGQGADWPNDLAEIVYIDGYGNAMTGIRAETLATEAHVHIGSRVLARARTFGEMAPGEAFWYANANGLVEIAVNQGRADRTLGLRVGTEVQIS